MSQKIDTTLGIWWLSETLRGTKEQVDFVSTDGVNSVIQWATQFRDDARWVIDSTKETIDTVREQAARAEETIWEVQESIENMRGVYESTTQSIEDISWSIRQLQPNNQTSTGSEN